MSEYSWNIQQKNKIKKKGLLKHIPFRAFFALKKTIIFILNAYMHVIISFVFWLCVWIVFEIKKISMSSYLCNNKLSKNLN